MGAAILGAAILEPMPHVHYANELNTVLFTVQLESILFSVLWVHIPVYINLNTHFCGGTKLRREYMNGNWRVNW